MQGKSFFQKGIWLAVAAFLFSPQAWADGFQLSVNGHDVSIEESDDGQVLKVDGEALHSDYYVFIDRIDVLDGQTVLTGTSSAGGNACEGAPFMLLLDKAGKPRLDGPVDTCLPTTVTAEAGALTITEVPVPGREAQQWSWTASAGLVAKAAVPFAPDNKGWSELKNDQIGHPADLLSYQPISAEVDRLLGPDKSQFLDYLVALGSARRKGEIISGSACVKSDCPDNAALLVADLSTETLYLAWKPAGEKIRVRPAVSEWPESAKAELREWAAPWK